MDSSRAPSIDGTTRLVGIIGDPVAHSLSPALHNAAFAALGLNYAYVPLLVAPVDLPAAIGALPALGFVGANVTVPHKQAAAALVHVLRGEASLLGTVNTVVNVDHRLEGHNTDVEGFVQAYLAMSGQVPESALLLGAGGAARAAALGLLRLGTRQLTIANRTLEAARDLAELVESLEPTAVMRIRSLAGLRATDVASACAVVNATTLGMAGGGKVPDVVADNVGVDQIVYDVVYASGDTDLVRSSRLRGARAIDGREMLVRQAAAAFELWTGIQAPIDVMRDAVAR